MLWIQTSCLRILLRIWGSRPTKQTSHSQQFAYMFGHSLSDAIWTFTSIRTWNNKNICWNIHVVRTCVRTIFGHIQIETSFSIKQHTYINVVKHILVTTMTTEHYHDIHYFMCKRHIMLWNQMHWVINSKTNHEVVETFNFITPVNELWICAHVCDHDELVDNRIKLNKFTFYVRCRYLQELDKNAQ